MVIYRGKTRKTSPQRNPSFLLDGCFCHPIWQIMSMPCFLWEVAWFPTTFSKKCRNHIDVQAGMLNPSQHTSGNWRFSLRSPILKKCKFPGGHCYCVREAPQVISNVRYLLKVASLLISNNEPFKIERHLVKPWASHDFLPSTFNCFSSRGHFEYILFVSWIAKWFSIHIDKSWFSWILLIIAQPGRWFIPKIPKPWIRYPPKTQIQWLLLRLDQKQNPMKYSPPSLLTWLWKTNPLKMYFPLKNVFFFPKSC